MMQNEPKSELRAHLIWGTVVLLFVLFFCGFLPRALNARALNEAAAEVNLPEVTVQTIQPNAAPITVTLPGSTQADHITPIWARANGYLVNLLHDIGDVVKKDDLLALLDTPEVDQQYLNALNTLNAAIANRDIAKISKDRWDELWERDPSSLSRQEVDERDATYLSAEANLKAAYATMEQFKDIMEFKRVVAPFDGVITERDVDLGSLITAGSAGSPQQLFVIAKTDIMKVYVEVPQCFFRSIDTNLKASVKIREFPERAFMGTCKRYAKALDPTARTMTTQIDIDNRDGTLIPGLFADVTFTVPADALAYTVPTAAVIIRAGPPFVAVLDEVNTVHLRPVTIIRDSGTTFTISDGLKPGDRIVTNPNEKILEGVKVKVLT